MINEREFLQRTRLDQGTLEIWIRESWICPDCTTPERTFTDTDLARANLISDLKDNMGVNDAGLDVVLHLIDQMHGLRRALADALASIHEQKRG
jgi:chaperone modulatory protein CbpM